MSTCLAGACLIGAAAPAFGDLEAPAASNIERVAHVCAACHGEGGNGTEAAFPKLAGQQRVYTATQLRHFRDQKRADSSPQAYMWGISALLDDNTIDGLAEHYAKQKPVPGKRGDPALIEKGKRIFNAGIPGNNVGPCASCHGNNGEGKAEFPRLAGQHADYIVRQMKEFRTKLRPRGPMSEHIVKNMSEQDMRAVAAYLQANP